MQRRERHDGEIAKRSLPRSDDVAGAIGAARFSPVELDHFRRHGDCVAAPIHLADRALEPEPKRLRVIEQIEPVGVLDQLLEYGGERRVDRSIGCSWLRARARRSDGDRWELDGEMSQRDLKDSFGCRLHHDLCIQRCVRDLAYAQQIRARGNPFECKYPDGIGEVLGVCRKERDDTEREWCAGFCAADGAAK
jgi:hypothetical protein